MRKLIVRAMLVLAVVSLVVAAGCSEDSPTESSNNAPTIESVTVAPASVNPGGSATVTVMASDPDGDALSYAYFPSNGAISGSGSVATWTAPMTNGTYSVTVTVTDGNGGEVSASDSLMVDAPVTTVQGTVLHTGLLVDLGNGVVSIYASWDDWCDYQAEMTVTVLGIGGSVTYSLTNVPPGTYWIDYWLDSDFSQFWSSGDFVAWYGSGTWGAPTLTWFMIAEGETRTIDMEAVYIP